MHLEQPNCVSRYQKTAKRLTHFSYNLFRWQSFASRCFMYGKQFFDVKMHLFIKINVGVNFWEIQKFTYCLFGFQIIAMFSVHPCWSKQKIKENF